MRRRPRMLATLSLVLGAAAPATPFRFRFPVDASCVSSPFGPRRALGPGAAAEFHNGIDLPAPAGTTVRAAAAGTVTRIERKGRGGLQVFVTHPGGLVTLYAHLGLLEPALIDGATRLAAGAPIGRVGRSGLNFGPHLFFAVFAGGRAVDPALLLPSLPRCGARPAT